MNLHEKCLLRYLQKPDELSYTTEILKLNNYILEKQFVLNNFTQNDKIMSKGQTD
jgi:hypothetical protein